MKKPSSFALEAEETPSVQNVYITPSLVYPGSILSVKAEVKRMGLRGQNGENRNKT
jgi:hypothetical protein